MAVIAFDPSALVRRYDRHEPGSPRVRARCERAAGNPLLIARVTPVEIASALNRKGRERVLDSAGRDRIWRLFQRHRREPY
jgi:predicted nucleic acid-binding protein